MNDDNRKDDGCKAFFNKYSFYNVRLNASQEETHNQPPANLELPPQIPPDPEPEVLHHEGDGQEELAYSSDDNSGDGDRDEEEDIRIASEVIERYARIFRY